MTLAHDWENIIQGILKDSYNISAHAFEQIDSYSNVNLKFCAQWIDKKKEPESDLDSKTYLAKIFVDFDNEESFSLLQHFMANVNQHGIPTSHLIYSKHGQPWIKFMAEGKSCTLMVLTFVNGISINKANLNGSEFCDICYKVGVTQARMHKASEEFTHPLKDMPCHRLVWMVRNHALIEEDFHYIKDECTRNLAEKYLRIYRSIFLQAIPELRKGFIHADISDTNIIIKQENAEWDISGIIDFENCHHGAWIGDLGVSCAYFLAKAFSFPELDCLAGVKRLLAGYQSVIPLTTLEKKVLLPVICARLVLSYTSACKFASGDPENEEYLFCQAKAVPDILSLIDSYEEGKIQGIWFG